MLLHFVVVFHFDILLCYHPSFCYRLKRFSKNVIVPTFLPQSFFLSLTPSENP